MSKIEQYHVIICIHFFLLFSFSMMTFSIFALDLDLMDDDSFANDFFFIKSIIIKSMRNSYFDQKKAYEFFMSIIHHALS